jgi:hypothetical protein
MAAANSSVLNLDFTNPHFISMGPILSICRYLDVKMAMNWKLEGWNCGF